MKKYFFMAAVAAAMTFASCSNEDTVVDGATDTYVTIRVAGAVGTKAIEAPGSTAVGTISLQSGHVFVLSAAGGVVHQELLSVTAAQSAAGQNLGEKVPSSSTVYVVGNLPPGTNAASWENLNQIKAAVSAIETQDLYQRAALANVDAIPVQIGNVTGTGDNKTATATVLINPAISRIELSQIKAKENSKIKSFDITGVFVDSYHTHLTWGGSFGGSLFNHGVNQITPDLSSYLGLAHMHNRGTWPSNADKAAFPPALGTTPQYWAYNVAAGALPRLIIRLTNIELETGYTLQSNAAQPGVYYLTVTGYTGVTTFQRGVIYRIGGTGNDGGITFDEDDLTVHPNPDTVTLSVNVDIVEWEVEEPAAELSK
jgi:hypothetical protein